MLARHESTITVADSCQSVSPGPTPKKRPYTQVFSTPVAARVGRASAKTTPTSPLKHIQWPLNNATRKGEQSISGSGKPSTYRLAPQKTHLAWDDLDKLLHDAEWLAERMSRLLSQVRAVQNTPSYAGLIECAHSDYDRLAQTGDFDDHDMASIAQRYIVDRHLLRIARLSKRLDSEYRAQVLFQSESCLPLPANQADECVPPTPPDSHPGMSDEQDESPMIMIHDHDHGEDNDDNEDELPTFEAHLPSSPCSARTNDSAGPELPPWPASGAKELLLSGNAVKSPRASRSARFGKLDSDDKENEQPRRSRRSTRRIAARTASSRT